MLVILFPSCFTYISEMRDAKYHFLKLLLRMHAKLGEVIKGLESTAVEIETVYNSGVIDGFDKKSVS